MRRGRPPVPLALILTSADALFANADAPGAVTMDDIAAAAGVGKGTLFRAFGNRAGLLDALWQAKIADLRQRVDHDPGPLGPGSPPQERVAAFLDAVLCLKLANRHLLRAREVDWAGLMHSENYAWMHALLQRSIETGPHATADDAGYAAHALLAAMNIDLVEQLLESGRAPDEIRRAQEALVRAVVPPTHRR